MCILAGYLYVEKALTTVTGVRTPARCARCRGGEEGGEDGQGDEEGEEGRRRVPGQER